MGELESTVSICVDGMLTLVTLAPPVPISEIFPVDVGVMSARCGGGATPKLAFLMRREPQEHPHRGGSAIWGTLTDLPVGNKCTVCSTEAFSRTYVRRASTYDERIVRITCRKKVLDCAHERLLFASNDRSDWNFLNFGSHFCFNKTGPGPMWLDGVRDHGGPLLVES